MEETFYRKLLDNLYEGVYFLNRDRVIIYWNKSAELITGYPAEQVLGKSCRDNLLNHITHTGMQLCTNHCPMQATMNDGKPREAEVYLHHADGHRVPVLVRAAPIRDKHGNITGSVETFSPNHALMSSRRRIEELKRSVLRDPLTEIGNRRYLDGRLEASLTEYKINKTSFGVIFCDIDKFKKINDTYGHTTGDKVLRMVSQTLNANIRATDTIGRWGGEEFLLIFQGVRSQDLLMIGEVLRMLVAQSGLVLEQEQLTATVSIGGTTVQENDTAETLVNRADQLMYQSKMNGRNRVTIG